MEETLLNFFKVFSDVNRLKIAALLAGQSFTIEQIAGQLEMRPVDVPRHLKQISRLGLLIEESGTYQLDVKGLEKLSRETLSGLRSQASATSNDANADAYDQQVVKNFCQPDGSVREFPLQEKKLQAILRHVVQVFEPGKRYTEKEVNVYLARFNEDTALLRRALIDQKLLDREPNGSAYWKS